jgi:hypothetical protein
VLWGGAALALIAAATAIALDQARRRREEEARQREEMERRNAAQRAREAAERARIAAAAAARAQQMQVSPDYGAIVGAALGAAGAEERIRAAQDRRVERREEEMEAAEQAAMERAEGLREIAEGRDQALSETTTPRSATPPEDLFAYVPSFSPIERDDVRPVVSLGVYEVGVRTVFQAGGRLNPILRVTPTKISFHMGPLVVNVGWQGNTLGLGFRTPEEVVPLDDRGTVLTRRQVGSAVIQWNGWNTTLQARYNYLDYTVAGPGQATWYGAGSQGLYFSERVVQVAVGLVAVLAIAGTALLFGPQVAQQMSNALGGMRGPIAVPGN